MINKIYKKIRSSYRRVAPQRLECFSDCKAVFQTGVGLEIGGASGIFGRRGYMPIYPLADRIDNCNFSSNTVWKGSIGEGNTFVYDKKKAAGRQFITEASDLSCIADCSYDFVLSSHCIEHLANPLKGLHEWVRVLKKDGLLVLVVPHKDGTFDHRRLVTSLTHLIQDFESEVGEGDLAHLEEILEFHDLSRDPGAGDFESFRERSMRNIENRCLHQHVFDTRLAVSVVDYMKLQILAVELFLPYHIVIVARKPSLNQGVNNNRFLGVNSAPCWHSPFPEDQVAVGKVA